MFSKETIQEFIDRKICNISKSKKLAEVGVQNTPFESSWVYVPAIPTMYVRCMFTKLM